MTYDAKIPFIFLLRRMFQTQNALITLYVESFSCVPLQNISLNTSFHNTALWVANCFHLYVYLYVSSFRNCYQYNFAKLHNMNKTENLLEAIKANLYLVHVGIIFYTLSCYNLLIVALCLHKK